MLLALSTNQIMNRNGKKHSALIGRFFREIWQDVKNESANNLAKLLYFFILLGLFFLVLSFSHPRF